MTPDITYVLGYRDGRYLSERRPHFYATINNLLGQTGVNIEILVVEDAKTSLIKPVNGPIRHFYVNNVQPYLRSQVGCIGLYEAHSPYMVLHDADVLVEPDYTAKMLDYLKNGAEVLHIGKLARQLYSWETRALFLSKGDLYKNAHDMVSIRGPRKLAYDQPFTGYSIGMNIESAKELGGFSMKYIGWGYEDASFIDKATRKGMFINPREATIIHMEHPRPEITEEGRKCAENNRKLFELQTKTDIDVVIAEHRKELEAWRDTKTYTRVKGAL